MKCRKVRKNFSLYRDEVINSSQRKTLKEHLDACSECGEEWRQYAQALDALPLEKVQTIPQGVWNQFYATINEASWQKEQRTKEELIPLRIWGVASVSFAMALLVLNWAWQQQEIQDIATQNLLTKSQYGKVVNLF